MMNKNYPIVVLGASGRVGGVVASQLLSQSIPVKAVGRRASHLKILGEIGAEVFVGVFEDEKFLKSVFDGAMAAFIMTPGDTNSPDLHEEQRQNNIHIVNAIKNSNVKHVVFLSSWGAELPEKTGTIYGSYLMEQLLNDLADVHVVHLRAVWFMDNFIYNISLIKMANINGLAIDGNVSFPTIYSKDIGIVAADYLSKLNFTGKTIHYLQGVRNYTMNEVTKILGTSIGKPNLKYVNFPKSVMMQGLKSSGSISDNVAQLLVETNEKINSGKVHGEARNSKNTTTTTLEEFASTNFKPAYDAEKEPSFMNRLQGTFLRWYLKFNI
jgi:uncharacterized protein YbjT (DUF2867 family)